jgi:hypothetical protein
MHMRNVKPSVSSDGQSNHPGGAAPDISLVAGELRALVNAIQAVGAPRNFAAFAPGRAPNLSADLSESDVFGLLDMTEDVGYHMALSFAQLVGLLTENATTISSTQWLAVAGPMGDAQLLGPPPGGLQHIFVLRPRYVLGSVTYGANTYAEVYHVHESVKEGRSHEVHVYSSVPPLACSASEWTAWWRSVWTSSSRLALWMSPNMAADNLRLQFVWHISSSHRDVMSREVAPLLERQGWAVDRWIVYDDMPDGIDKPYLHACHVLSGALGAGGPCLGYDNCGISPELRLCMLWAVWSVRHRGGSWPNPASIKAVDFLGE